MPIYKKNGLPVDRRMATMLAVRLNQIAEAYPTRTAFEEATGLSRATLHILRTGRGNPTFHTLSTLASSLQMPVWNLLGLRIDDVQAGAASFGINYEEIEAYVAAELPRPKLLSLTEPAKGQRGRRSDKTE